MNNQSFVETIKSTLTESQLKNREMLAFLGERKKEIIPETTEPLEEKKPLTEEEMFEVFRNKPAFKAHQPGTIHTFSDGREYVVAADGSWRKTKEESR